MESITVKDEDVARYMGRKLKVHRGDVEFVGTVSGWVDVKGQRLWVLEAGTYSMNFMPSEGWAIIPVDDHNSPPPLT